MARSDHVRYQLFLPRALSKRFEQVSSAPGVTKSAILEESVTAFLDRKGDAELELKFAKRLDQTSKQLERIERNHKLVLEGTSLLARYMFSVIKPLAAGNEAGQAEVRERCTDFLDRVQRQLAGARFTFDSEAVQ